MGYLGLDQTEVKDDNMFQRIFWPSDHAGETDSLGQQGFWMCWAYAVLSFLLLTVQGHLLVGMLSLAFFGLGGIGVREHSQPAAVLVAVAYWLNQIAGMIQGRFPGFLWIVGGCLLIANIRGTYIAAKWAAKGDPDAFPERASTTLKDRFVDQMPARVWPHGQIPFYVIAVLYVLLTIAGAVFLMTGLVRPVPPAGSAAPSTTLEVTPTR